MANTDLDKGSQQDLPSDLETVELDFFQADLDDESPEVLGSVLKRLLEEGALDATASGLAMKKGRPGVRIEVLAQSGDRGRILSILLRETSTLGVRRQTVERYALARREGHVEVNGRRIGVKVALWEGKAIKAKPEFEDCSAVAKELDLPVREVIRRAERAIGEGILPETG